MHQKQCFWHRIHISSKFLPSTSTRHVCVYPSPSTIVASFRLWSAWCVDYIALQIGTIVSTPTQNPHKLVTWFTHSTTDLNWIGNWLQNLNVTFFGCLWNQMLVLLVYGTFDGLGLQWVRNDLRKFVLGTYCYPFT